MAAAEEILERLRQEGGRITTPRRLVVETLVNAQSHMTADDVAAAIQRDHPEVHLSTVYRTLESLEELGLVGHTHVGHGATVYHVGETHQHLISAECGAVIDVPLDQLEQLREMVQRDYGFTLQLGHFAMLGRCRLH